MAPPPKNQAEVRRRERYIAYNAGWADGAHLHSKPEYRRDRILSTHTKKWIRAAYRRGFTDGELARDKAHRDAAQLYGIDLERAVLR